MPATSNSFIILNAVDSTNNYAMAKVHAGLSKHGNAYFSSHQTAGKGQRGKTWQTGAGLNIALSIVLELPGLNSAKQFHLSVAVALGCFDFFSKYAGNETCIKWPNDIFWRDRKAGGILIENIFHGKDWKFSVAGIGININQSHFDGALKNPVSLKQVTGKTFDTIALAKELHQSVLKRVTALENKMFGTMLKEYNQHLFCLHKKVRLKKDAVAFETCILGVTENGKLITKDISERLFDFGEVTWVL
jgi:BirA family transcriptional regulator, biotin operon repressor / biotin---[acetyl-CoA-carboxylase] ligase